MAALKDEAASKGRPPLIWTRADGYQLGAERAALEAYERQMANEKLTPSTSLPGRAVTTRSEEVTALRWSSRSGPVGVREP